MCHSIDISSIVFLGFVYVLRLGFLVIAVIVDVCFVFLSSVFLFFFIFVLGSGPLFGSGCLLTRPFFISFYFFLFVRCDREIATDYSFTCLLRFMCLLL
jgi:hypothetical protein